MWRGWKLGCQKKKVNSCISAVEVVVALEEQAEDWLMQMSGRNEAVQRSE